MAGRRRRWVKNQDNTAKPFTGDKKELRGTFDNGATTPEIRFLSRAYRLTKDERCLDAVNKGLDLILKAQYPTGAGRSRIRPTSSIIALLLSTTTRWRG